MKCPNCNKEIENDSKFCEHCGAKIDFDAQKRQRLLMLIVSIIAIVIFSGVILAIVSHYEKAMKERPYQQLVENNNTTTCTDTVLIVDANPSIILNKMQVLYAGIANPVTIEGLDPNKYSVSFSNCTVKNIGSNTYQVKVPNSLIGKTVTASITALEKSETKTINEYTYRVKRVPDPQAMLGNDIRGGKRSKSELLAKPFLKAVLRDDFEYDLKWTINSYQVIFISKGYEESPLTCGDANFSDALKQKIEKSGSGTIIVFTGIKASSEAGQRSLDEITVRIK